MPARPPLVAGPPARSADPGCCPQPCPQTTCTTRYVQRCYYQPVVTYKTNTYYEPVTTYRTSYYYQPVTSYRYSCYYDPCTCRYQSVATPQTCYQLRSRCCPVTSYLQRTCMTPVTAYQQSFYYEPVTTCCTTTTGAPVASLPPTSRTIMRFEPSGAQSKSREQQIADIEKQSGTIADKLRKVLNMLQDSKGDRLTEERKKLEDFIKTLEKRIIEQKGTQGITDLGKTDPDELKKIQEDVTKKTEKLHNDIQKFLDKDGKVVRIEANVGTVLQAGDTLEVRERVF